MSKTFKFPIPEDPIERDRFFMDRAAMIRANSTAKHFGKLIVDRELAESTLKLLECLEPDDFGRLQADKRHYEDFELLIEDWKKQLKKGV